MTSTISELKARFVEEFHDASKLALDGMRKAKDGRAADREAPLAEAESFFHKLAGLAETFGFPLLGHHAFVCERVARLARKTPEQTLLADLILVGLEASERELDTARTQLGRSPEATTSAPTATLNPSNQRWVVAIVDDDKVSSALMDQCLGQAGFSTYVVNDAEHALDRLTVHVPDLILLDVMMPGIDGFSVCEEIRRYPALETVPILFVTARRETGERVRGLNVGGNDYIVKPFSPDELIARVSAHLERMSTIRDLAIRDSLTRVYNHAHTKHLLELELKRAQRHQVPLTFGLIDVDRFKGINDRFGHQVGDRVLRGFVEQIEKQLRVNDVVGRYGGDEFAVILPQTPIAGAQSVAQRICEAVSQSDLVGQDGASVSASIGLAVPESSDTLEALIEKADQALYRAKAAGRNRVEI